MYKIASLICISSLPFLFTLHGDFVFDDSEAVVKNKDVSSESWTNAFTNDFWGTDIKNNISHKSYRPLTILSFRFNYNLSGKVLSAIHFKITNLLCHILCTILLYMTYRKILKKNFKKDNVAYLSAIIFGVHPVHVEAVSGIVGRADILAGITFFLAFLSYVHAIEAKSVGWLFLSTFLAAISMLFKENGVTVLGYCICYDIVINLTEDSEKKLLKRNVDWGVAFRVFYTSIVIITLLYSRWCVMGKTTPIFKATDNPAYFEDIFVKIATYNYIYFLNILLMVWPQWLCYDWSMGCVPLIKSISDYRMWIALSLYSYFILIIIKTCARKDWRLSRPVLLGVLLIVIPFLPATNVFYPVGFVIAERILYIPSAGYSLLIGYGLERLLNMKKNKIYRIIIYTFYVLLLMTYSLRCYERSSKWQNEYQLFTSGLQVCPQNAKVHYNVAKAADASNYTEWAVFEYKEAIRLYPEYYQAMNNLANILKNKKEFNEAESYLKSALKYNRNFPAAWMNLGIVLASLKRHEESHEAYKIALEYRKNYPDCLYNLGNLYLEMNKTEDALESWFQAINLNETHVLAWTNLLALLDNTAQFKTALEMIPQALERLPNSPSINFAIANIYGKMERYLEAEAYFKTAIQLFGQRAQPIHYANLGVLYHRWKKYSLAEEMYKKALLVDPTFKSAQRNLNSLKRMKANG